MKTYNFYHWVTLFAIVVFFSFETFGQIEITDLVTGKYMGTPWSDVPLEVAGGTKHCWQFDRVDGTIANDSGIVAGSYWLNDPENWPANVGQELRNDEMDIHYAVFRYNGGAGVFRSHGQWARYTIENSTAGYYRFKFRCRQSADTDGFPLVASIETADSVKFLDSIQISSFRNQTIELENIGLSSWFATIDSLYIPGGISVLRLDLPSVSDDFNGQGRFGELGFISVDSTLEIIEDTIQEHIYEYRYLTESFPDDSLVFQMYLPSSIDTVKGICFYVDGGVMNGLWWMFQSAYVVHRDYYARNGYAFMVANLKLPVYGSYDYNVINNWMADAVYSSIDSLAQITGHSELKYSPIFLYGHSNGSIFSHNFILCHADRILGVFLSKGAANTIIDTDLKRDGLQVPTMFVPGETDGTFSTAYVYSAFERGRGQGALWSFAVEPGMGHSFATDTSLALPFFRDVVRQRIPDSVHFSTMPILKTVDVSKGYLGNHETYVVASNECYPYQPLEASWLPGINSAMGWQRFVSGIPDMLDTLSCESGAVAVDEAFAQVYPNPANRYIIVKQAQGNMLSVYDTRGTLVKQGLLTSNDEVIYIDELSVGMYYLQIGNTYSVVSVAR